MLGYVYYVYDPNMPPKHLPLEEKLKEDKKNHRQEVTLI